MATNPEARLARAIRDSPREWLTMIVIVPTVTVVRPNQAWRSFLSHCGNGHALREMLGESIDKSGIGNRETTNGGLENKQYQITIML